MIIPAIFFYLFSGMCVASAFMVVASNLRLPKITLGKMART